MDMDGSGIGHKLIADFPVPLPLFGLNGLPFRKQAKPLDSSLMDNSGVSASKSLPGSLLDQSPS